MHKPTAPGARSSDEPSTLIEDEGSLTETVLAAYSRIEDPRLRTVIASLITHMHACVREVRLTSDEWHGALGFLNLLGQETSRRYNGAMALSDMLGISTLVCMVNDDAGTEDYNTASSVMGPLWRHHAPAVPDGGSILRSPTAGAPLFVDSRVVDTRGLPIEGVEVHIWQATPYGRYENQDEKQAEMNLRGRLATNSDGSFRFRSVMPGGYPISDREPIASLVKVASRNAFRPAHLHFIFYKPGFETLITQVFSPLCPHLHKDVAFGVTRKLMGNFIEHQPGSAGDPDVQDKWYSLNHTFVMAAGVAILPEPPID